jgi:bifunctional polynucleotide phosphatase/kinase
MTERYNNLREYSQNWKDIGSILMYKSNDFQYHNTAIICELENCLIDRISTSKLYHSINPTEADSYDDDFIKKIKFQAQDKSIIVISNQLSANKLNIDMIKRKLESFIDKIQIPILALFSLKNNKFSKPHTGIWNLLCQYYKTTGQTTLTRAIMVSDNGGRIIEKEKKSGDIAVKYGNNDIDRAFANNIGIPYLTINDYTKGSKEKFIWSKKYIEPELRKLYIEKISQYKNPNIFAKLAENPSETYIIMIYGAPRSGKTTLARELITKWRNSDYGKHNEIKRLGSDLYTSARRVKICEKYISDRISVIIDGECHTDKLRLPYKKLSAKYGIPITYIEVNPGIALAYLFNHTTVENAMTEDIELYPERNYHLYNSMFKRPEGALLYCPIIKKTKELMEYRY